MDEALCDYFEHEDEPGISGETLRILRAPRVSIIPKFVNFLTPNPENFPNMELKFSSSSLSVHSHVISVRCPALLSVDYPLEFEEKIGQLLVKYIYRNFTLEDLKSENLEISEILDLIRLAEVLELLHLT